MLLATFLGFGNDLASISKSNGNAERDLIQVALKL
jgi:hypothetical protein